MAKAQPALRISQLDAEELDSDLVQILKEKLRDCFNYTQTNWFTSYDPELSAVLKLFIWRLTLYAKDATVGQQLLDLEYRKVKDTGQVSRGAKCVFALLTILGPWLSQRASTLATKTSSHPLAQKLFSWLSRIEVVWKVTSLLHFLLFLREGRHQFLSERLVGMRAMFPKPQGMRQVGFEYMDRELLWHGFAEFLFFILPLVNFRKIRNLMIRTLMSQGTQEVTDRCLADYKECVVCGEWPYNPHHIGCKHVFCYYCLQANYTADPGYACPVCGHRILHKNMIHEVRIQATTVIEPT